MLIIHAVHADEIITGSFVNAEAIVRYIRRKDPEKMVLEEVLAMITWIIRTERVLPGTLADALETGTMEALTKRMYRVTHYSEKEE